MTDLIGAYATQHHAIAAARLKARARQKPYVVYAGAAHTAGSVTLAWYETAEGMNYLAEADIVAVVFPDD